MDTPQPSTTEDIVKQKIMREIKFRAWDKKAMAMSPEFVLFGEFTLCGAIHSWQHQFGIETPMGSLERLNDLEIMQFIGLKDKNKIEIYEGDIVSNGYETKPIIFSAPSFGTSTDEGFVTYSTAWEVIGNIYQTPELLK